MEIFMFILNSILLGLGLTMDAFSVSIADGLNEPNMKKTKTLGIAGTFAFFQFAMPMIGWVCVYTILVYFKAFAYAIPWIALILLLYIGGKMIVEGFTGGNAEEESNGKKLTFGLLMLQGVATAIDALSVGFTISDYSWWKALIACLIIAAVTFACCMVGLLVGKKVGDKLSSKATIFGGVILVGIGFEVFLTNMISNPIMSLLWTWLLALFILLAFIGLMVLLVFVIKNKNKKSE